MRDCSGCLVDNPACNFAVRFGFSYLCEHPQHMDFHDKSDHRLDHNTLYNDLRKSRRSEYLSLAKKFIEDIEHGAY
jgi:hypothetical protein